MNPPSFGWLTSSRSSKSCHILMTCSFVSSRACLYFSLVILEALEHDTALSFMLDMCFKQYSPLVTRSEWCIWHFNLGGWWLGPLASGGQMPYFQFHICRISSTIQEIMYFIISRINTYLETKIIIHMKQNNCDLRETKIINTYKKQNNLLIQPLK